MISVSWTSRFSTIIDLHTFATPSDVAYLPKFWGARTYRIKHHFFLRLSNQHALLRWAHLNLPFHLHNNLVLVHITFTCMYSLFYSHLIFHKRLVFKYSTGASSPQLTEGCYALQLILNLIYVEAVAVKLSQWSDRKNFFACCSAPLLKSPMMWNALSRTTQLVLLWPVSSDVQNEADSPVLRLLMSVHLHHFFSTSYSTWLCNAAGCTKSYLSMCTANTCENT